MIDNALWLDGNGIAGLLAELFGSDMTAAERLCQSCGERNAVGAHRAYLGAAAVLRCPACGDVAARVAILGERHVVELSGTWLTDPR